MGDDKIRVLCVDDDRSYRHTCMAGLGEHYLVTEAESLAEAHSHLRVTKFDLILSDYNLSSSETGMQVFSAAREAGGPNVNTPFILMSAALDKVRVEHPEYENMLAGGSIAAELSKPLKLKDLRETVANALPGQAVAGVSRGEYGRIIS